MKTKGMGVALLSAAALLAGAANAGELSWNYAEIGYQKADGSDFFEADAFDISGSVAFAGLAHAQLDYVDGDADGDSFADFDFDGFRVIAGVHPQLTPNTQLIADLMWFDFDLDGSGLATDGSTDGFGLGFGLRHSLADNFELFTEVWYTDGDSESDVFEDEDSTDFNDTVVEFGGRYHFNQNISTGLTVGINGTPGLTNPLGSGDVIRLDARWSFGTGDFSDSF